MSDSLAVFLIGQGFIIACGLVGFYVKVSTKLKELEIRVGTVERQDNVILSKLDTIGKDITDIKVELKTKQDRA